MKEDTFLGKKVDTRDLKYSPDILVQIPREDNRKLYGIQNDFKGVDVWRNYEVTCRGTDGKLTSYIALIKIPSDSPYIIESKSMKLYFFSLNNEMLSGDELSARVTADFGSKLGVTPEINILLETDAERTIVIPKEDFKGLHHFNNFRSNCKVTGQPDFADLVIDSSKEITEELSTFVDTLSRENHFHEEAIELIYSKMKELGYTTFLVAGLFTRRGGIDICPVRYTEDYQLHSFFDTFIKTKRIVSTKRQ